jgi:methyl-accepting chemotaxis protein
VAKALWFIESHFADPVTLAEIAEVFRAIVHQRQTGDLLLVARDMGDAHTFDRILIGAFIWGGLFTTIVGLTGAAIVGAGAVHRIDAITRAIQRIVSGDLSERLPTQGRKDDFDRLAHVSTPCWAKSNG